MPRTTAVNDLRNRADAIAWARSMVAHEATVFLDTETTGLDGGSEIIEIAVVDCAGLVLLDTYVRPRGSIPTAASLVHGIFDVDVRSAPAWREIHDGVEQILQGRPIVVYNASFDRRLLSQSCAGHGLEPFDADWQCAMLAYAAYRGETGSHGRRPRWHSLDAAAVSCGVNRLRHRALDDAMTCLAVVSAMADGAGIW